MRWRADRDEIEERGIKNPKSVFEATPWQRMFFMAAGPGINFITALVLFIAVALVGQPYRPRRCHDLRRGGRLGG